MKPRYIVLGPWRSGTTVIHESLGLHPHINVAYEILHSRSTVEATGIPDISNIIKKLYSTDRFAIRETIFNYKYGSGPDDNILDVNHFVIDKCYDLSKLVDYVFERYNAFKILYCQVPRNYKVWDHLVNMRDLKVIHVQRRDYLAMLTSLLLSYKTGVWNVRSPGIHTDDSITMSVGQLESFFELIDFETEHFQSLFSEHDNIIVDYEDIKNWESLIRKVQKFLNLQYCQLYKKYNKRTVRPLRNLIYNYDELSDHFKNTKYKEFFK